MLFEVAASTKPKHASNALASQKLPIPTQFVRRELGEEA